MGEKSMDPIKKAMADMVAAQINDRVFQFPDLPIESIQVQRVSNLESLIRVKTTKRGIRYFTVQIRENL